MSFPPDPIKDTKKSRLYWLLPLLLNPSLILSKHLKAPLFAWIKVVGFVLLLLSVVVAFFMLILGHCYHIHAPTFTAFGEAGLVLVIAVEGLIAIVAFTSDERTGKINANAALFDLYKIYLSVDYHKSVRTPAWYALEKARESAVYRNYLIQELTGFADPKKAQSQRRRYDEGDVPANSAPEDIHHKFHDESHRLFDVLGFFATLANLSEHLHDDPLIRSCNFYYEDWSPPLHNFVKNAQDYDAYPADLQSKASRDKRCAIFEKTLTTLDAVFQLKANAWINSRTAKNAEASLKEEPLPPRYDFSSRVALVTGAASEIGRATAKAFATSGASVVLVDQDEKALKALMGEIKDAGGKADIKAGDLVQESFAQAAVEHAILQFGRLDMAYHSAGDLRPIPLSEQKGESYEKVNLIDLSAFMKHELIQMNKQGSSAIVNCSSLSGFIGLAGQEAYNETHQTVIKLTKGAALEAIKSKIRVNAVSPGFMQAPIGTPINQTATNDFLARQPIGRAGTAVEVASAVMWLCSPGASLVTGTALPVDGGFTAQ